MAFGIDILVRIKNGPTVDPSLEEFRCRKGDPVDVRPAGFNWGRREVPKAEGGSGNYCIITITGIPDGRGDWEIIKEKLLDTDEDDQNEHQSRYRRAWTFLIENIPSGLRDELVNGSGRASRSFDAVKNFIKHRRTDVLLGDDE